LGRYNGTANVVQGGGADVAGGQEREKGSDVEEKKSLVSPEATKKEIKEGIA